MSFRDLKLKESYDSDEDDILDGFYVEALKEAVKYDRIAGYFSSTSLAVAAEGVASFIVRRGKMRLIMSIHLSDEDYEAIEAGTKKAEEVVADMVVKDLQDMEDEIRSDHVKALAWMVANGTLQIRLAITDKGIFHQKCGVLEDSEGNRISFSGSDNESATGWLGNVEEFKVFRSWDASESKYLDHDSARFENFWEGQAKRTRVIDVPTAIRDRLIELSPENEKELALLKERLDSYSGKKPARRELRDYQEEAIKNWRKNGYVGIFEMATGTGKTFTAIRGIEKLLEDKGKGLLVVVACPYTHLIRQWTKEFSREGLVARSVFGSVSSWLGEVRGELRDLSAGYVDYLVLVTTYDTFAKDHFSDLLQGRRVVLVCDEVHAVGTELRTEYLSETYEFRLGLSATPTRWLDPMGTDKIMSYFGPVVMEYSLHDAIASKRLVPYEYHIHAAELSQDEIEEYESLTKKIAMAYGRTRNEEKERRLQLLLIKRRNIVKNASSKMASFEEILSSMGNPEKMLVYCSDKQIDGVLERLNKRSIIHHQFTYLEDTEKRRELIDQFGGGVYQVLVAMKCLDEGVDIPPVESAILLASSGNPKEFIQRRGRLLRTCESTGKTKAVIHDIIVVPPKKSLEAGDSDLEKSILRKELDRYHEFSRDSLNPLESVNFISELREKYKL